MMTLLSNLTEVVVPLALTSALAERMVATFARDEADRRQTAENLRELRRMGFSRGEVQLMAVTAHLSKRHRVNVAYQIDQATGMRLSIK